jgi:hypothetical protein
MNDRTGSVNTPADPIEEPQDADRRTRQLQSEVAQTREEMSETIDAIQEKLRPSNIVAGVGAATRKRVTNMAQSAAETAEDWWESAGDTGLIARVKNNPLPAALAGLGLAWLAFSESGHRHNGNSSRGRKSTERGPRDDDWASEADREWRSRESSWRSQASRSMEGMQRQARRGQNRLNQAIYENPLAVGAAAVVLGAALGLAIPETERENEWMGEARENAMERVQEAAQGAVEQVKDAAADAAIRAATGGGD